MSELPEGWATATLEEVSGLGGLVSDGDWIESKDQDPEGSVRLIQLMDVGDGHFNRSNRFLNEETAERLRCTKLCAGDVLIARMPDPLGRACVFPGVGQEAVTAVDVLIWRTGQGGAVPEWLKYAVNSPDVRDYLALKAGGTTRQRVAGGVLKKLALPVPPLAEQRRIVAKLDTLTARTARARADLDRIPALAARYKQAVLAKAFSGELTAGWRTARSTLEAIPPRGEIDIRSKYRLNGVSVDFVPPYEVPDAWRWLRLPELGDMDRGKSRHRPRDDARLFGGPFPFVQTGEVRAADRYLTSFSKTYSAFGLEQSRLWPAGTVCITIAANIAETAILGIDACFPDSVVGFSADPARCLPAYVEYFIRTAKADLEQFAPATAQKNINLEVLGSVRLPVAPLGEQAEIVRRIDCAFAEIDRMTTETAAARRLLDRLDQTVLAKAFRGDLVPQDLADEPASVLLGRIRAECASSTKVARGRRKAVAA